jgi:hypothetical protein
MTDQNGNRDRRAADERPATIIVPGNAARVDHLTDEDLEAEVQQVQDLGSASRSCTAIIAILLLLALLVCVFLLWAFFIR